MNSINYSSGKRLKEEDAKRIVDEICNKIDNLGIAEIKTSIIGEMVMDALERADKISLIRYASVYMKFEKPEDFSNFIKRIEN